MIQFIKESVLRLFRKSTWIEEKKVSAPVVESIPEEPKKEIKPKKVIRKKKLQ